jgi:hypothetical protein
MSQHVLAAFTGIIFIAVLVLLRLFAESHGEVLQMAVAVVVLAVGSLLAAWFIGSFILCLVGSTCPLV